MKFSDLDRMSLTEFVAGAPKDALWCFMHIPKTAGSSFAAELNRHAPPYRNVFVDYSDPDLSFDEAIQVALETFIADPRFGAYRSASGHLPWNISCKLREARPSTQYISILREPVARVVSDYRYQRTPEHPPYKQFIEKFPSLESFADGPNARNKMARFVTGKAEPTIDETLSRVDEDFTFIGLLEMYPMTLNTIFALMGVPNLMPAEYKRKTPDTKETRVKVTPEIADWIAEINSVDMALYHHVRQRLLRHRGEWREAQAAAKAADAGPRRSSVAG